MGNSYTDLQVWQFAIELVTDVYKVSRSFPREELYGLSSQLHVLPFPSRAISQRGKAGYPNENSISFLDRRVVR